MPAVEPSGIRKTPFGDARANLRNSPFDVIEHLRAADAAAPIQSGYEIFSLQHAFDGLEPALLAPPWEGLAARRQSQSLYRVAATLSWTLARLTLYGFRLRLAAWARGAPPSSPRRGRAVTGALSWRRR